MGIKYTSPDRAIRYEQSTVGDEKTKHQWYKFSSGSLEYFTPFKYPKMVYKPVGDGDHMPSPMEMAEELNSKKNSTIHANGRLISYHEFSKSSYEEIDQLPPGFYRHLEASSSLPERLMPTELRTDGSIVLGGASSTVGNDIRNFLENEQVYRDMQSIYKFGALLYGSPGTGKSIRLRQIVKESIPEDSICIFIDSTLPGNTFLERIKQTLADRLKVFILEELCTELSGYKIAWLLNFLDGEQSLDRTIILGTTNYPEKLPGNLVDRPSRFDKLYKFENPDGEDRLKLLGYFIKDKVTPEMVKITEGLSVAQLKEAALSMIIREVSLEKAVKELKDRTSLCKSGTFAKSSFQGVGF